MRAKGPERRTRVLQRHRRIALTGLVVILVAGTALSAACGEKASEATVDGYWTLTTDEATAIRIDAPEGTGRLRGLSAHDLTVLPADGGGYTVPGWHWRGAPATAHLALSEDGERLTVEISVTRGAGSPEPVLTMVFVRASADPHVLDARIDEEQSRYAETGVKEGVHTLQVAVQSWMVDHDGKAPPVDEVRPGGAIKRYVDAWPDNPYVDQAMQPGEGPGEYTYERLATGRGYRITGHLEDGEITVP